MDKLNEELIDARKRLYAIEEEKKKLEEEYSFLQDKIHYYFDSSIDTSDTEKFIINDFWSNAYKKYKDGGYITNDEYISKVRFDYETQLLNKIIEEECKNKKIALDIGCGNGRYTREFSNKFELIVGLDLSTKQIDENKKENNNHKIEYINDDFMTMDNSTLQKFDFIFVGDIFMYTNEKSVDKVFNNLLKLLNNNGILIVRESTRIIGFEDYKSKNYVAYYRNREFYKEGIFSQYFKKCYRNYAYNLYHLTKYFNLFENQKEIIETNPFMLEEVVENSVDRFLKSSHFYLYRK
ncbi:class I SAM-dependent methyltransferase [Arcobacter sp.]|uniref:class I SAM-dependent methyltransferase n=1 Tax=unclassified Arcobacter TaxID=2593671 RepID=UPI003AFF7E05